MPDNIYYILSNAFSGMNDLEHIDLGVNLTSIDDYGFYKMHCDAAETTIKTVVCRALVPPVMVLSVFSEKDLASATLDVPDACISIYMYADTWREFASIRPISEYASVDGLIEKVDGIQEIWTLDGTRIDGGLSALCPGIYIVRKGKTTEKLLVRYNHNEP